MERRWVVLGVALVLLPLSGCNPGSQGYSAEPVLVRPPEQQVKKEAAPVPKTTADVEKLGIPVYPGATLSEEADSTTLEEKSYTREYKVKMYAPANYATVLGHYARSLKGSKIAGASEFQKVIGKTSTGDAIEVWVGPAAGKDRSLILAFLIQTK